MQNLSSVSSGLLTTELFILAICFIWATYTEPVPSCFFCNIHIIFTWVFIHFLDFSMRSSTSHNYHSSRDSRLRKASGNKLRSVIAQQPLQATWLLASSRLVPQRLIGCSSTSMPPIFQQITPQKKDIFLSSTSILTQLSNLFDQCPFRH